MSDSEVLDVGIKLGYVSSEQLEQALIAQRNRADHGEIKSLWRSVQDLGFIDRATARELLHYRHSTEVRAMEIEGFAITRRIGGGGMGTVYEAVNTVGEEVAIKLLPPVFTHDVECAYRFRYEARLTRKLHHPHVVRSFSSGLIDGQRYLVMELVKGPSLAETLRRHGPLDEPSVLHLLAQIASALSYAWGRHILHRDIKPANILLGPARLRRRREPFCAKLCDFGLAKIWARTEEGRAYWLGKRTGLNRTMGTPDYMSPEQATGQQLDHRSDIYNLGATAFHALIGNKLFQGSVATIMEQQRSTEIDFGVLAERGVSEGTIAFLAGMLHKDPERRWSDWEVLMERLRVLSPKA